MAKTTLPILIEYPWTRATFHRAFLSAQRSGTRAFIQWTGNVIAAIFICIGIIALVDSGFIVLIAIMVLTCFAWLLLPLINRAHAAMLFGRSPAREKVIQLRVDETGVHQKVEGVLDSHLNWSVVHQAVLTSDGVMLRLAGTKQFVWIPHEAIAPHDGERLEQILESHVPVVDRRPAAHPTRLTCVQCGYFLRGLNADSNCPECGTSTAFTRRIREEEQRGGGPRNLLAAIGIGLVVTGSGLLACFFLIGSAFFVAADFARFLITVLMTAVGIPAIIGMMAGRYWPGSGWQLPLLYAAPFVLWGVICALATIWEGPEMLFWLAVGLAPLGAGWLGAVAGARYRHRVIAGRAGQDGLTGQPSPPADAGSAAVSRGGVDEH